MPLDSAQAKVIAAQPRITPDERDRLVSLLAEGKKPAELAVQFGKAVGTIYNFQTRNKDEINQLRRMRSVEFNDVPTHRKQARLDGLWDLYRFALRQLRLLQESAWVIDGDTGETREVPVDGRKAKPYADMITKALRSTAEELGQLPARLEGLDHRWTHQVLGLMTGDGHNQGIDYSWVAERQRQWVADEPKREAERLEAETLKREREEFTEQLRLCRFFEEWLVGEEKRLAQGRAFGCVA
jgi:hypothetical protein